MCIQETSFVDLFWHLHLFVEFLGNHDKKNNVCQPLPEWSEYLPNSTAGHLTSSHMTCFPHGMVCVQSEICGFLRDVELLAIFLFASCCKMIVDLEPK